jgi:cytosine deaminase
MHAETNAFRNAGRQKCYKDKIMVTTLSPCWFCCGLIKQFKIGTVVIGDNTLFQVGESWMEEQGVKVIVMNSEKCKSILSEYIDKNPDIWNEDIGECD